MSNRSLFFLFFFSLLLSCNEKSPQQKAEAAQENNMKVREVSYPEIQQIVVVTVPDWNEVQGQLRRFEWNEHAWREVGNPWPIVVGKSGMAWADGQKEFSENSNPLKIEGDKRSPAGVFKLGSAFGYSPRPDWAKVPYIQVVSTTMCIEDGSSKYYNQIIDEKEQEADWNSTDHMLRKDDLYEWGVFVAHNSPEAKEGFGSCIFLHVWRRDDSGTAGCTAMDKGNLQELIAWLDPQKRPTLVQLPESASQFSHTLEKFGLMNF